MNVFQPLKRKPGTHNEVESSQLSVSPGYTNIVNSPLRTPVSGKGGRIYGRSNATKITGSGPQTPIANAGETFYVISYIFIVDHYILLPIPL